MMTSDTNLSAKGRKILAILDEQGGIDTGMVARKAAIWRRARGEPERVV